MRNQRHRKWVMAAAMAIVPVVASQTARAQFSSTGNGHALDANNQVGSGGYNGSVNNGSLVTGNDIVWGNVTGGKGLTGALREADPTEFRGTVAGSGVDSFIAGSSGMPTSYAPQFSLIQPRPFYADSRGVAPPPGSVIMGFNGSGVGTDLSTANPYASVPGLGALASQRFGSTNVVSVTGAPNMLSMPGSPGSADPTMQAALANAPGVTVSSSLQQSTDLLLNPNLANGTPIPLAPTSLSDAAREQLRQLMQGTSPSAPPAVNDQSLNGPNSSNPNSDSNSSQNPNGASGPISPLNSSGRPGAPGSLNSGPLQTPIDSAVTGSSLGRPLQPTPLGTYTGGTTPIQLAPPAAYSPQYAQMLTLVKRFNPQASSSTAPGRKGSAAGPTTLPAKGAGPGAPLAIPLLNAEPVKISSLADGIDPKAKDLHAILAAGDGALKQGQYKTAIEQYGSAMRVDPNNMLFVLGRANAELGAGYYGQAEMDIRRAVLGDPTVLMARFDLSTMMNADRLQFAQKDLQDLTKDAKASRPWFLLAYLAYNASDTNAAASDLREARKRSGSADQVIGQMEKYWALPGSSAATPTPELNK